ncbi:MAG: dihydroorotate dehydrogenase electron transfer subunit [Candidatus Saganbacteria bacterium]|nr:dihydroorotate dehydrogenase electron transfer subunit [Candidatus Saganbacteria bacterium]
MPIHEKARILEHIEVAPKRFKLVISSLYISTHAQPGQFVMVRVSNELDPLLRRPLGINGIRKDEHIIELLYEVKGKGTEILSKTEVNELLDIVGPLGTGFTIKKEKPFAIVVAGGMGVAPMCALIGELKKQNKKTMVLLGARNKETLLCEEAVKVQGIDCRSITDDGSNGRKGFVSELLNEFLNEMRESDFNTSTIFACGPKEMLKVVAEIAFQKKIECQVSLEEKMACGIGACMGCVVKTKSGHKKVCDDGPVFNANDLLW